MRRWRAAALTCACLCLALAAPAAAPRLRIEVSGVDGELLDNVRATLSIEQYRGSADLSDASVERLHARAPDEIRAALRPFGYYQPTVEAQLDSDAKGWTARYRVAPGTPVRLAAFDVAVAGPGADEPAFRAAVEDQPLRRGGIVRHDRYEALKQRLLTAAEDSGYLAARFTASELRVDPTAGTATITLELSTGPRSYFGSIVFEQDVVAPRLLDRYLEIKPGEPFSVRRLLDLQYALNDSDYFRLVEIEPDRAAVDAQGRVPVRVRLTARERTRWTFGLGYGTDTGPRGTVGWEDRRFNSLGHRATVDLSASQIKDELTFGYSVPLEHPATERLSLQTDFVQEHVGDAISHRTEVGASLGKTFGPLKQTLYSQFQYERSDFPVLPDATSRLLILGVNWTWSESDAPLYTTRGRRLSLDVHGARAALLSDLSFLQYHLSGKYITAFGGGSRFLARAEYARSFQAPLAELPLSQRLYAGGDQSVRGYGYQSLGASDGFGNVLGGTTLATASAEIDHLFTKQWGAAVFLDVGDAVDGTALHPHYGAGFGLRWLSPIGMLRLDLARPVDSSLDSWHLHFSIGPDL